MSPKDSLRPDPGVPRPDDAALARRVQMLATEHWGLLAARSTAQSEVLVRITIYLTLVSAGLVTLGLFGQATGFADWFPATALSILGFLALMGALTQLRVLTVGQEDMMYVVAMNRLRVAYTRLDPELDEYFLAATTDDFEGMNRTYSFILPRSPRRQIAGSSMVLIAVVNACVVGLLVGFALATLGGATAVSTTVGVLVALGVLTWTMASSYQTFRRAWSLYQPLRPTPGPSEPTDPQG